MMNIDQNVHSILLIYIQLKNESKYAQLSRFFLSLQRLKVNIYPYFLNFHVYCQQKQLNRFHNPL
jgi:hypothetical protein